MSRARVLAVDDQRYFRELMKGLLSDAGYAVQTAGSGEEALDVLDREDFDIVLTDLVMPGIDGIELVSLLRERRPDQDVVMVTGVADVKTAVDAMKLGITDYILKPFDRDVLHRSLEAILDRRRLRDEHSRLVEENQEVLGVLSLHERAAALFSTLGLEALCERTVEGASLETQAQGAVVWAIPEVGSQRLSLLAARGLVRVEEEAAELDLRALDPMLEPLTNELRSVVVPSARGSVLWLALRQAGELLGLVRVSDKLDGEAFGDRERAAAEKFASLATVALSNALRFRALERMTLRDPTTNAYTYAYLQDIVRNEVQKSSRFGRSFSLAQVEVQGLSPLVEHTSASQRSRILEEIAHEVSGAVRSTDLLASQSGDRFRVLLPETDAIGAAVLCSRIREAVLSSEVVRGLDPSLRPNLVSSTASYPVDGAQVDTLLELLDARSAAHANSLVDEVETRMAPFGNILRELLERGRDEADDFAAQVTRVLIDDVARRPRDRGILFVGGDDGCDDGMHASLRRLARSVQETPASEIVRVADASDEERAELAALPMTWVSGERLRAQASFILYYGDGPAYAAVAAKAQGGQQRFFDTDDRPLVEQLAFRLQRELGIGVMGIA